MTAEKDRKEALKEMIKRLHAGEKPEALKEEFKKFLEHIDPGEISRIEQELIKEGMPLEEIRRFCDVHIAAFKEAIEKEGISAPPWHPLHILMEEHKMVLSFADRLKNVAEGLEKAGGFDSIDPKMDELRHLMEHFRESESHYQREENVLFPSLEKKGITQPPAIMWMEHDRIRSIKKRLYAAADSYRKAPFGDFVSDIKEAADELGEALSNHFYKENRILFPAALNVIDESEWKDIRRQFDELGYCCFTPVSPAPSGKPGRPAGPARAPEKGEISFGTGSMTPEQIEAVLNTLPVDVTFVDETDTVRYFSQTKERIFPRTTAIIGLKVQRCHPEKSIHVVNQILDDFRNGRKDSAEFWIDLKGRLIYIRYFAVRGGSGRYLGCLEVTQDITDIKKIEGEKRLL